MNPKTPRSLDEAREIHQNIVGMREGNDADIEDMKAEQERAQQGIPVNVVDAPFHEAPSGAKAGSEAARDYVEDAEQRSKKLDALKTAGLSVLVGAGVTAAAIIGTPDEAPDESKSSTTISHLVESHDVNPDLPGLQTNGIDIEKELAPNNSSFQRGVAATDLDPTTPGVQEMTPSGLEEQPELPKANSLQSQ